MWKEYLYNVYNGLELNRKILEQITIIWLFEVDDRINCQVLREEFDTALKEKTKAKTIVEIYQSLQMELWNYSHISNL